MIWECCDLSKVITRIYEKTLCCDFSVVITRV